MTPRRTYKSLDITEAYTADSMASGAYVELGIPFGTLFKVGLLDLRGIVAADRSPESGLPGKSLTGKRPTSGQRGN
jgi:hypothetical protein